MAQGEVVQGLLHHAQQVLAKIHADRSGSVSVIFPKEAERLREEIKNMLVDDARACHWNRNLMKWSNERYDSTNENRVLNCDPIPFLEALQALADSSEYVSELKIMGLIGSPCLVPRMMLKLRLTTSLFTCARCPWYNLDRALM